MVHLDNKCTRKLRDYSREREKGGLIPPVKEASIAYVDGPGSGLGPLLKAKPRLRSQAASVDRSDPEKPLHMDRYGGPARDSGRYSPPPRAAKRRASEPEREQDVTAAAGEVVAKSERKQKGSVFSRISFPAETGEGDRGSSKRRKTSSEPPANGLNDHRERERERPVVNGYTSSSAGHRSSAGGYDHESSDEERHFKRRSSSSRRDPEKDKEEIEEGGSRPSRVLRERDNRVHERHEAKRRC